jgi:hypothetical protein
LAEYPTFPLLKLKNPGDTLGIADKNLSGTDFVISPQLAPTRPAFQDEHRRFPGAIWEEL